MRAATRLMTPASVAGLALVMLLSTPAAIAAGARGGASSTAPDAAAAAAQTLTPPRPPSQNNTTAIALPSPTHAGYLDLPSGRGSIYYMYYEAEQPDDPSLKTTPVLLWLQGGPGCSSLFGAFYINGPYLVNADLTLRGNPGRWNRKYGTLYVDQPLGVGFSVALDPERDVPAHELPLAADLYVALNSFYAARGPSFSARPLFVTGESYAGKYVPSIAHYVLQAHARAHGYEHEIRHPRRLLPGAASAAPAFPYGGCAIGNGFTDAVAQTLVQAEVAHNMGLIDWRQREQAEALQRRVVDAVRDRRYRRARELSDRVLALINGASGLGTLEDVRREKGYDAEDRVSQLLNLPEVRRAVGVTAREEEVEEARRGAAAGAAAAEGAQAPPPPPPPPPPVTYESCSPLVDRVMGADVMHSTAKLVPDLLAHGHVMLYHGQFDAECGARSNEAWMEALAWPGHSGFRDANRTRWWGGVEEEEARRRAEREEGGAGGGGAGATAADAPRSSSSSSSSSSSAPPPPPPPLPNAHSGFLKSHMRLTHYVVRNAGHMVPHDRPEVGRALIEEWVDGVLDGRWEQQQQLEEDEEARRRARGGGGRGGTGPFPRVAPGRRPPPLAGPWAGWGSRRPDGEGFVYDADPYYAEAEADQQRQQQQQEQVGGAGGAPRAAATF